MSNVGPHRVADDELQGALFDVDGTLVDSMPRFFPAWNIAGARWGISMTEDQVREPVTRTPAATHVFCSNTSRTPGILHPLQRWASLSSLQQRPVHK